MKIRPEEPADWVDLSNIYAECFGHLAEAGLVQRLHADGDAVLALTAWDDKPVGHIVFSRLDLIEAPEIRACALAPLVVAGSHQQRGVGSALVKESLRRLTESGFDLVLVLGEPGYYTRFGFSPDLASRIKTPYDGPFLLALALSDKGKDARGGITYAKAFAELR